MRTPILAGLLALIVTVPLACGGSTPPPKTEDETASASASASEESTPPAEGASAAPTESASAAPSTPPPETSTAGLDTKPAAQSDVWMASHQVPSKDVLKTMKPANGKVQACYKTAHKKEPSLSGEVKIKFVISNDGVVKDWKDEGSTISDEGVTKCVGEVLKKLKFPKQKSPGDAWGTYSISFGH
jgi:hypothetical protein